MENIFQSRILPYKFPIKTIKREKLIDKIHDNINKGLILINAPAGYGKTILIQQYLAFSGMSYSWLNIHRDMSNFYIFMNYLIHSIKKVRSDFGNPTMLLIDDYRDKFEFSSKQEKIIEDITSTFINELHQGFDDDLVIVLDEPGNLEDPGWVKPAFKKLFENIPRNIHFVITSRNIPAFSQSLLLAKQNILKIETAELAFSTKETAKLVRELYRIDSSEKDINLLTKAFEGWITGLHLILQSHGEHFTKLQLDKLVIVDDIFNYFTEDIFNELEEEIKEFILYTSLLENFTVKQCNVLFKSNDSQAIINRLLQKNIFIQVLQNQPHISESRYCYQGLFKKFLNVKIKETKSSAEIQAFLKNAAEYYTSLNEFAPAINYLFEAGEIKAATGLINKKFQDYFDSGNFDILWSWIEKAENSGINDDHRIYYYKALLLKFFMGSIEESLPILDKAITLSRQNKDDAYYVISIISKARNLISLGKITEAVNVLSQAEKIKTEGLNKAKLLYLKAYTFYQNSLYDKALKLLNEALMLAEKEMVNSAYNADLKLEIFNLYGHIFLIKGDYSKSISYYEKVAGSSKKLSSRYESLCNLVLLYSHSAKFDKALIFLDEAGEISRQISIPIFRITFLLAKQAFKFEFGDYEDSIKMLVEMNRIASEINHKYYIFLSYSLIGDSYYWLDKLNKADEYYDMAFRYINENSEYEKIQFAVSKALLIKRTSAVSEIEEVLLKAYNYYEEQKMIYSRVQTAFHLADFYKKSGNLLKSFQFLKEVLTVSSEKEYSAFLQREILHERELFDFALANRINNRFVKEIINSAAEKNKADWISDECRQRFEEKLESFNDIHLILFGKNEVRIRGRQQDDSAWGKKKWKLIFIYLLVSARMTLSKDKIIDIFYPETPAESAENIFHQMISKFRNLFKTAFAEGTSRETEKDKSEKKGKQKNIDDIKLIPSLISYEDKQLQFSNDFIIYIDSVEFEKIAKKLPVIKDPSEKLQMMEKAIELYKGDFMDGNYETWCEELRTKYRTEFISISEELIKKLYEKGEYNKAMHYSEYLLKYDPLNIVCYEYIINSMIKLDKPQIAMIRYNQLVKFYKKEYDETLPEKISSKLKKIITG
ncbi:MAG: hypothetical protein J0M37_07950 [Ignavibacteria bacterium]|nr:hypothetical protein [Ignavibacteria bacterium]